MCSIIFAAAVLAYPHLFTIHKPHSLKYARFIGLTEYRNPTRSDGLHVISTASRRVHLARDTGNYEAWPVQFLTGRRALVIHGLKSQWLSEGAEWSYAANTIWKYTRTMCLLWTQSRELEDTGCFPGSSKKLAHQCFRFVMPISVSSGFHHYHHHHNNIWNILLGSTFFFSNGLRFRYCHTALADEGIVGGIILCSSFLPGCVDE